MCAFVKLIGRDQYRYEGVTEIFYTRNEMEFKIEYNQELYNEIFWGEEEKHICFFNQNFYYQKTITFLQN